MDLALRALQAREARCMLALRGLGCVPLEYDIASGTLSVEGSPNMGCAPEALISSGRVHPADAASARALLDEVRAGKEEAEATLRARGDGGEYRWTRICFVPGVGGVALGMAVDVDARVKYEEKLERETRYRHSLSRAFDGAREVDVTRNAYVDAPDGDPAREYAASVAARVHPDDRHQLPEALSEEKLRPYFDSGRTVLDAQVRARAAEGRPYRWWEIRVVLYTDERDGDMRALLLHRDIHIEKEEALHRVSAAQRDDLTGLLNAAECERRVAECLRQSFSEHGECRGALLLLDMDGMRLINDALGHSKGDDALLRVANALKRTFRDGDVLARLGGDEFAAFMRDVQDSRIPEKKTLQLLRALGDEVFDIPSGLRVTLSVGIAPASGEADYKRLIKSANIALYRAQKRGGNQFAVWG